MNTLSSLISVQVQNMNIQWISITARKCANAGLQPFRGHDDRICSDRHSKMSCGCQPPGMSSDMGILHPLDMRPYIWGRRPLYMVCIPDLITGGYPSRFSV